MQCSTYNSDQQLLLTLADEPQSGCMPTNLISMSFLVNGCCQCHRYILLSLTQALENSYPHSELRVLKEERRQLQAFFSLNASVKMLNNLQVTVRLLSRSWPTSVKTLLI